MAHYDEDEELDSEAENELAERQLEKEMAAEIEAKKVASGGRSTSTGRVGKKRKT